MLVCLTDVTVDGGLPVRGGKECRDGTDLQLPKQNQNEAAFQPYSRASRSADENPLFWGRGGGLRLCLRPDPVCKGKPPNCLVNCSVYCISLCTVHNDYSLTTVLTQLFCNVHLNLS